MFPGTVNDQLNCHGQRCESYRTQKNRSVFMSNTEPKTYVNKRKEAEQRISVRIWHRTWLQESATHCKQGPASQSRLSGGFRSSSQSPWCGQDTFLSCTPSPHVVEHCTNTWAAAAYRLAYVRFTTTCTIFNKYEYDNWHNGPMVAWYSNERNARIDIYLSGGATPGRARSNDLTGRSTALAQFQAPPCLALRIALFR